MIGEADSLGIGFFGWVDMFMPIPEPLMLERRVESAKRVRQIAFDENRFAQPCVQNAIQNGASYLGLLDTDRLEVGLMIESPGCVVVTRRITGSDIERHVQTTCDFVKNLTLELGVRGRRLLSVHLSHLPTAWHR